MLMASRAENETSELVPGNSFMKSSKQFIDIVHEISMTNVHKLMDSPVLSGRWRTASHKESQELPASSTMCNKKMDHVIGNEMKKRKRRHKKNRLSPCFDPARKMQRRLERGCCSALTVHKPGLAVLFFTGKFAEWVCVWHFPP
jgi:hypothetical protein